VSGVRLAIAQVNTRESRGGAESVARQLTEGYGRRGHDAWLIVGREPATGPGVLSFPAGLRHDVAHAVAGIGRVIDRFRGLESYRYPRTARLLDALPRRPDLIHLHNLHGGYFDLRVLPRLSRQFPVVLTLHDAWLLSGHCAHSFDCDRWRTGCGACPDLRIYPAVRRDATDRNWRRKRTIFEGASVYVATPSRWLADRVSASLLAPAVKQLRVIPNGIDLGTFTPDLRSAARAALGVPPAASMLVIAGNDAEANPFKDFPTMHAAAVEAAARLGREVLVFILGSSAPASRNGHARVHRVPFLDDAATVARYLQAADVYLHASKADTFPTGVIEAMACGTPVVATVTGGIPEQLQPALTIPSRDGVPDAGVTNAAGILVAPGDSAAMAMATASLLDDAPLRDSIGRNAAARAAAHYDRERQCDTYLEWYRAILDRAASAAGP
jgi:glycosyltransferase involved in cell wall biosynthesis